MRLIADESERLDRFLARQVPDVSRTRLAKIIDLGQVLVDGDSEKPSFKLEPGMEVVFELPPETPPHDLTPADIALDIPYEDDDLLVRPTGGDVWVESHQVKKTLTLCQDRHPSFP